MTDPQLGVLLIGVLLVLIAMRVPIGAALVAVPFVGIYLLFGWKPAIGALKVIPYNFAANWQLSSVPMFLMMGFLAYHTGITRGLFQAARLWLSRLPGGLAVASIFGAAGFASVTGSSVACAAAMGRIAVPEMLRQGYDDPTCHRYGCGSRYNWCTHSTVNLAHHLWHHSTGTDQPTLHRRCKRRIVDDILLCTCRRHLARINPAVAPRVEEQYSMRERIHILIKVGPVILLAILVFGGLFLGVFTPTEAGAVGAVLCALIAFFNRTLTWARFRISLIDEFYNHVRTSQGYKPAQ